MKFSMKFTNIEPEFEKKKQEMLKLARAYFNPQVSNLFNDLVEATPVKTGKARASWSLERTPEGANIKNTVEYIDELNAGSSKQAPAFFIEQTALKYGTPKGAIVEPI